MKKFLKISLVFMLIFFISACGKSTPEITVKSFFKSLKSGGVLGANKYLTVKYGTAQYAENVDKLFKNDYFMFSRLTYNIKETKIDGNTASVDLTIKQFDLAKMLHEIGKEDSEYLLSDYPENLSYEDYLISSYKEKYNDPNANILDFDVTITLKCIEGEWLINDLLNDNLQLTNAILGSPVYFYTREFNDN